MLPENRAGLREEGSGNDLGALMGACPLPLSDYQDIVLAHGSGGKLSQQLIQEILLPQFRNELLDVQHDGAVFSVNGTRLAFSTDSFVVSPIFFPGGDIGKLAVHGTVNDLAMCGARPLYLSAGFILEEGLSMQVKSLGSTLFTSPMKGNFWRSSLQKKPLPFSPPCKRIRLARKPQSLARLATNILALSS
jgi:hypothetical protein